VIPAFDANGNLPPGIYYCTLAEVVARFGHGSSERQVETNQLVQFVQWARQVGVRRLLVNGSYITSKAEPNDVDVVVLPGAVVIDATEVQFPFLHVQIAVDEADVEQWARVDFGEDRNGNPKGILEVEL
jgi:hypothetical protein